MKKNKVILKVMLEVEQKKWIKEQAKLHEISEGEVVRRLLEDKITIK